VDAVMAEAGLTAGGFYAHFDSKQALLAEALEHAAAETGARLAASTSGLSGREWVEAFLEKYLNLEHCRNPGDGCPLAALVSEVARADATVKERFDGIVRALVKEVASHLPARGSNRLDKRTIAVLAMCLGGIGMARAVRDEAFAQQILESCRAAARDILGATPKPTGKIRPRRRGKVSKASRAGS
jgi:TetR/AcrR family transcriptional repressor of nem operon